MEHLMLSYLRTSQTPQRMFLTAEYQTCSHSNNATEHRNATPLLVTICMACVGMPDVKLQLSCLAIKESTARCIGRMLYEYIRVGLKMKKKTISK